MPAHSNSNHSRQKRRKRAYYFGQLAEWAAALYLQCCGYRIVARRFQSGAGEVDLIGVRGTRLVACEVKARMGPVTAEVIHPHQQRRITTGVALFLAKYPKYAQYEVRFDALCISLAHWPRHIRNAWQS